MFPRRAYVIDGLYAFIIWTVVILVPILLLFLAHRGRAWFIFTFLSIAWIVVLYGSFIEPRMIHVNRQSVALKKIKDPFTIALISDLHAGHFKGPRFTTRVVQKIISLKPDLVLIAGDIIYHEKNNVRDLDPLGKLPKHIPVYAVLGNHDFGGYIFAWPADIDLARAVQEKLESLGIVVLENESRVITMKDQKFSLIGLGEVWVYHLDVPKALAESPSDLPRIAFVHNPDAMLEAQNYPLDLVLAGHTHGGQVRLPILGPIGIIPTALGQYYDKGWFSFKTVKLFITSGLGESTARARLFNPPEIVLLTIK